MCNFRIRMKYCHIIILLTVFHIVHASDQGPGYVSSHGVGRTCDTYSDIHNITMMTCTYTHQQTPYMVTTTDLELKLMLHTDAYLETVAKLMVKMSGIAYSDAPVECMASHRPLADYVITQSYHVYRRNDYTIAYCGYSKAYQVAVCAIGGTETITQFMHEITDSSAYVSLYDDIPQAKVLEYFAEMDKLLAEPMIRELWNILEHCPDCRIYLTGHSLGAALASLIRYDIARHHVQPHAIISVYAFGQPRIGNYDFAQAYNKMVTLSYRIVNLNDPIVHLPKCQRISSTLCGDGHDVTDRVYGYHIDNEIFYINMDHGQYRMCVHGEDSACADGQWLPVNIYDHLNYWIRVGNYCGYK